MCVAGGSVAERGGELFPAVRCVPTITEHAFDVRRSANRLTDGLPSHRRADQVFDRFDEAVVVESALGEVAIRSGF